MASRALERLGAEVVRSYSDGPTVLKLPASVNVDVAARQLGRLPGVLYAERDGTVATSAVYPSDSALGQQWGLNAANDVDVDAPEAWGVTPGSSSVIVAVLDTGMDVSHPELAGRLWVNPGEIPGNGRDDDGNGFADDVNGWDFSLDTGAMRDLDGHGTHVSGIIAAQANNGFGTVGVAPAVRLMPVRFIGANGEGAISDAVDGIYYAVANGARVINASWGGGGYSQALADAIRYAGSRNVVFVTAAGNDRLNLDNGKSYPASYRYSNTLNVAAVDASGRLASFSNYGSRTVDVAAPGVNILSTVPGGYETMSGTSMATPFVSGVVALVTSMNPAATAAQVVQWVIGTAKPMAGLSGRVISGGMVSAGRAVGAIPTTRPVAQTVNPPATPPRDTTPAASQTDDDVRAKILGSEEYYRRAGGTPSGFVSAVYQAVIGRPVDRSTLLKLVGQLQRGTSRQQIARSLTSQSAARQLKVARWLVSDLHLAIPPATLAGRPDVNSLAAMLASGTPDSDVRAALLDTSTYRSAHGDTPQGFVAGLYQDVLGRGLSENEMALWVGRLQRGQSTFEIARAILASPEARQTRVALWMMQDLGWGGTLEQVKANATVVEIASWLRA